jgi:hypothetical protein
MDTELDAERGAAFDAQRLPESNDGPAQIYGPVNGRLQAWLGTGHSSSGSLASIAHGGARTASMMQAVQRSAGNRAATAFVQRLGVPVGVQRDPDEEAPAAAEPVPVTGIKLTAEKVSIPLTAALTATAVPANATDVSFSLGEDTVEPTNATIGESDGVITVAAGQQGGRIKVKAESGDGSTWGQTLQLVESPTAIASTDASGASNYGGQFVHTFTAPSGESSGLKGANINESFESDKFDQPWNDKKFTLSTNAAGAAGWDLDSSGAMEGPDNVTIGSKGVDIGKLVESASNPTATGLPQGFTVTQSLFAKSFPAGTRSGTAFTTVNHTRRIVDGPEFEVSAGLDTISESYSGPAAVTDATASSATVVASPPKPDKGTWDQKTVTVTATALPETAGLTYEMIEKALGCTVDDTGVVSIGSKAGTVTVRVSATKANYDEVTITITAPVAPPAAEPPTGESATNPEPGAVPTTIEPEPQP